MTTAPHLNLLLRHRLKLGRWWWWWLWWWCRIKEGVHGSRNIFNFALLGRVDGFRWCNAGSGLAWSHVHVGEFWLPRQDWWGHLVFNLDGNCIDDSSFLLALHRRCVWILWFPRLPDLRWIIVDHRVGIYDLWLPTGLLPYFNGCCAGVNTYS